MAEVVAWTVDEACVLLRLADRATREYGDMLWAVVTVPDVIVPCQTPAEVAMAVAAVSNGRFVVVSTRRFAVDPVNVTE